MCDRLILTCAFWPGWIEADPSPDQQHWVWLWACLGRGLRSCVQWFGKWLCGETRAWLWRYWLWIWVAQPVCSHFYWSVTTF